MAVNDKHAQYSAFEEQWKKLRDCAAGQEAVHSRKEIYLPRLSGQSDDEYSSYKKRAVFYGATARTIDGLSGMIFRKEPQLDNPTALNDLLEDVTLDGMNFRGFAEDVVDDGITVGRAGILVDVPTVMMPDGEVLTQAQAEAQNIRPFLKKYRAESIINWKTDSVDNAEVLVQLRLWEEVQEPTEDEFEFNTIEQIRVLDLDDFGQYRQRIFRKKEDDDQTWEQFGDELIPVMNNQPLTFIPFVFVGVKNSGADVEKPPLIDLANVNLSHYVTTADLEHGAHFTALPTAVIMGHTDEGEGKDEFMIGSATAWVFPDAETKVEFLEFQGQGLESLEKRMERKEQQMAFLGARMLTPEKKQAEAVETAQIHRLGENSVLSSLSQSISQSLQQALEIMAEWAGIAGEIKVGLNKDFLAVTMSSQDLVAQLQAWQSGAIAFTDLLHNLKRGEIVQEDRTEDEIRSEVETENPFQGEDLIDDEDDEDDDDF